MLSSKRAVIPLSLSILRSNLDIVCPGSIHIARHGLKTGYSTHTASDNVLDVTSKDGDLKSEYDVVIVGGGMCCVLAQAT